MSKEIDVIKNKRKLMKQRLVGLNHMHKISAKLSKRKNKPIWILTTPYQSVAGINNSF